MLDAADELLKDAQQLATEIALFIESKIGKRKASDIAISMRLAISYLQVSDIFTSFRFQSEMNLEEWIKHCLIPMNLMLDQCKKEHDKEKH